MSPFRKRRVEPPKPDLRRVESFDDLLDYWAAYRGFGAPPGWQDLPLYPMLDVMLRALQGILGHADIGTTQLYLPDSEQASNLDKVRRVRFIVQPDPVPDSLPEDA